MDVIAIIISFCSLIVSIVVGIYLAEKNRKDQKRFEKIRLTFLTCDQLFRQITSEEVPLELQPSYTSIKSFDEDWIKKWTHGIIYTLNAYELASLKILSGYLDEEIIKHFYLVLLVSAYDKIKPILKKLPEINKVDGSGELYYQNFKELYEKWIEDARKIGYQPGKPI